MEVRIMLGESFEGDVVPAQIELSVGDMPEVATPVTNDPYQVWSEAIERRRAQFPRENFEVCTD